MLKKFKNLIFRVLSILSIISVKIVKFFLVIIVLLHFSGNRFRVFKNAEINSSKISIANIFLREHFLPNVSQKTHLNLQLSH